MKKQMRAMLVAIMVVLVGGSLATAISQGTRTIPGPRGGAGRMRAGDQRRSAVPRNPAVSPSLWSGIYVYSSEIGTISGPYQDQVKDSLNVPGVDGIVVVIGWSSLQPTYAGPYNWQLLDSWIGPAVKAHKQVELSIVAGRYTPSWLFSTGSAGPGAIALPTFTVIAHQGKGKNQINETLAAPWDSKFLSSWDTMLGQVAQHLVAQNTYDGISLIRLNGINRTTDEFRLPTETPANTGGGQVTDSIKIWKDALYTPAKLQSAWQAITTSYNRHFPGKTFCVAILPWNPNQYAFPPLDAQSQLIVGRAPNQDRPLLTMASKKFAGRFVIAYEHLLPNVPANRQVIQYSQNLDTFQGYQTNNYFGSTGNGAACGGTPVTPKKCTASLYLNMLETAIYPQGPSSSMRAGYIEVFPANVLEFKSDIMTAHNELFTTKPGLLPPNFTGPHGGNGGTKIQ